jgi:hypothetical protein
MARSEGNGHGEVDYGDPLSAPGGGGPHDPGTEARVAKLEAAVEHLQADMTEVRAALGRLEPKISEIFGVLPHLATKADLEKRPTATQIATIVAAIAAIASIPIWPAWVAAIKSFSPGSN